MLGKREVSERLYESYFRVTEGLRLVRDVRDRVDTRGVADTRFVGSFGSSTRKTDFGDRGLVSDRPRKDKKPVETSRSRVFVERLVCSVSLVPQ